MLVSEIREMTASDIQTRVTELQEGVFASAFAARPSSWRSHCVCGRSVVTWRG